MHKNYRLFMIALFGSVMSVTRVFVPDPISSLLIVVDAVLLALSTLFIKRALAATYVGLVGGLLAGLLRPSMLPFSFIFAFLYGVLVDLFIFLFKVEATNQGVNQKRLMAAMTASTLLIALISYNVTTMFPQFLERSPMLDLMVVFMGPLSGAASGYAAAYLWNKYLKSIPL